MSGEQAPHGFLVLRRGRPPEEPFQAGDLVDVYPLVAPLDLTAVSPTLPVLPPPADPHAAARTIGAVVHRARKRLREVSRFTCDCKGTTDPPSLATAVVADDDRLWVLVRQERVPAAFRQGRGTGPTAWPLHSEPNGAPHVEMTSCGACRRTWAIALTPTSVTPVAVDRPLFSRRVAE